MKSHPMIFTGESVRALLSGVKTQTRRIVKPSNSYFNGVAWPKHAKEALSAMDWDKAWPDSGPSPAGNPGGYLHLPWPEDGTTNRIYPHWQPGERIWARETWTLGADSKRDDGFVVYRADGNPRHPIGRWRPSSTMPRWVSRITLEVESVRPERLREIIPKDAEAEGCAGEGIDLLINFVKTWNAIHGKDAWDADPYVWVITIKRIDQGQVT